MWYCTSHEKGAFGKRGVGGLIPRNRVPNAALGPKQAGLPHNLGRTSAAQVAALPSDPDGKKFAGRLMDNGRQPQDRE